ncbi:microcompartment protein CcmL/EutN [Enterococcus rivorum]|uniref:BMC domain-containing protein n=1 Tax=Enterococcus rivorum TaxID=762845 RepID=A0A1E5KSI5_9ENTE|nr:microcompartment protein CcmL/EutN [Enterococcus rivorum]OEH80855.1 hypothetical protein BCR26_06390 [Enterococcus rivorum]
MNAIGLIETKGLIPAIEAADVMLKTAQVELIERSLVGGGIVTIIVTGDVGAVKSAVDAGASAVLQFGQEKLNTQHVIPRPHSEVESIILSQEEMLEVIEELAEETVLDIFQEEVQAITALEDMTEAELGRLSIQELRELAANYENLGLSDKALAIANKATLLKKIRERNNKTEH